MQTGQPVAPFEVYCARCGVTFPLGTRRCIHCGGPTGPRREVEERPLEVRLRTGPGVPPPADVEEEPEEVGQLVRPRSFSPLTLLWIALVVGGYALRTCAGH